MTILASIGYHKVASTFTDPFSRIGKCPRGFDKPCSECSHVRMMDERDRGDEFRCLDINGDNVEVRVYESPFIVRGVQISVTNILLMTYKDNVLVEARANVPEVKEAHTIGAYSDKFGDVNALFRERFFDLYTTGKITLHLQEDINR